MYESFYHFNARPFVVAPLVDRYFPGPSMEDARQTLTRVVERAEGTALIIGSSGVGKSLLCQRLADQFQDRFEVALLSSGRLGTRRSLLQAILYELKLPYRGMDEGELRLELMDHLTGSENQTEGLLLIVDEAHTLSIRPLDEVRLITNVVRAGVPRVRLVLAGTSTLEERFAHPKLESFSQRVAARCYLESLNRTQTADYIRHQLRLVGVEPESVFSGEAMEAVYRATDGIPRLINQVCDQTLMLGCTNGVQTVDGRMVEEAWAQLQQLPAPWTEEEPQAADGDAGGIVEFGSLDDEPALPAEEMDDAVAFELPAVEAAVEESAEETPATLALPAAPVMYDLDEEFRPAGCIGPQEEVPITSEPFGGFFEEEEVVIDHYATLDNEGWSRFPQVYSREGAFFAEMLNQVEVPRPELSLVHEDDEPVQESLEELAIEPIIDEEAPIPLVGDEDIQEEIAAPVAEMIEPLAELGIESCSLDTSLPSDAVCEIHQQTECEEAFEAIEAFEVHDTEIDEELEASILRQLESLPIRAEDDEPDSEETSDHDLIVLVDEADEDGPISRRRPPAHRMEYKQLFAQLRKND